jgi:hypothetical protein
MDYLVIKEKAGYVPAFSTNNLTENKYIVKPPMVPGENLS